MMMKRSQSGALASTGLGGSGASCLNLAGLTIDPDAAPAAHNIGAFSSSSPSSGGKLRRVSNSVTLSSLDERGCSPAPSPYHRHRHHESFGSHNSTFPPQYHQNHHHHHHYASQSTFGSYQSYSSLASSMSSIPDVEPPQHAFPQEHQAPSCHHHHPLSSTAAATSDVDSWGYFVDTTCRWS